MRGMRKIEACLYVAPSDRMALERLVADGKTPQKLAARARIVLLSGRGLGTSTIMGETRVSKPTVWRWQEAFLEGGIERLRKDKGKGPRAGKPRISDELRLKIVTMTAQGKPANATHWSARMLAKELGVGHTTVQRVWKEHGLKPHLVRSFKLSNDPRFAQKVQDIVGLYLDPPLNAIVLSIDEKSQIQALDRTQPGLPMKKGRAGTMTHDYKRNGTTTLFAALVAAKPESVTQMRAGEVIGECMPRHRAKEFLKFLKKIDRTVPKHLDIHAICDNYRTHKTKEVQAWLAKHPRFQLHFTPTSSSWLNLVERLFAEITRQRIRRGVFKSVADLEAAIDSWIAERNAKPRPFKWTAKADTILEKATRARMTLENSMPVPNE
jgi:transposase